MTISGKEGETFDVWTLTSRSSSASLLPRIGAEIAFTFARIRIGFSHRTRKGWSQRFDSVAGHHVFNDSQTTRPPVRSNWNLSHE